MRYSAIKLSGLFLVLMYSVTTKAQFIPIGPQISGPTSADLNETKTYTATNFAINHSWNVVGGTILSYTLGSTATCEVKWTSVGQGQVRIFPEGGLSPVATRNVDVIDNTPPLPPPGTPSQPWIISNPSCGSGKLRRGSPPSGVRWYWQTSSTSKVTHHGYAQDKTVNSSGNYYLRARRTSDGVWSTSASLGRSITVTSYPATPGTPTVTYDYGGELPGTCSFAATIQKPNQPSNVTFYWQGTNSSGTSTENSSGTYSVTQSGTYYLRAKRNGTNCWSGGSRAISIFLDAPPQPASPTAAEINCTTFRLFKLSSISTYWQGLNQYGTETDDNSDTYDVTSSGRYYLRAYNPFSECWSAVSYVDVTISQLAMPAAVTPNQSCGFSTLTKPANGGGISYYWQTSSNGEATGAVNSNATYTMDTDGTIFLRAFSNNCWSLARAISVDVLEVPADVDINTVYSCNDVEVYILGEVGVEYNLFHSPTSLTAIPKMEGNNWLVDENKTYYLRSNFTPQITVCENVQEFEISGLNTYPTVEAGSNITALANGSPVSLTGMSPVGGSWSGTGITNPSSNQFSASGLSAGNYPITYRFTNEVACTSTDSRTISLVDFPVITRKGSEYIMPGGQIQLSVPDQYLSYQWYLDNVAISGAVTNVYYATKPGSYKVMVALSANSATSAAVILLDASAVNDKNYVRSISVKVPGADISDNLFDYATDELVVSTTYYDGLGRPIQAVSTGQSPKALDIVVPQEYEFGRQVKEYLPYIHCSSDGLFKPNALDITSYSTSDQYLFYQSPDKFEQTIIPYSERELEYSPLARVKKQGAPGLDWKVSEGNVLEDGNNFIEYFYGSNSDSDNIWHFISRGGSLRIIDVYPGGQLQETTTTDEEDHVVTEFIDKLGRTILKRVQATDAGEWADTYYVYDDFGNLSYVLPPEGVKEIGSPTTFPYAPSLTLLARWSFQYNYDGRKRMIQKKVPGAEPVKMIYDDRDRLVLTQDGEQRNNSKWLFTKYDALNRPIITGEKVFTATESELRDLLSGPDWLQNYAAYETLDGDKFGYTSNSLPKNITTDEMLTVTYYDDYTFPHATSYPFVAELGNAAAFDRVKGQVTGTKIKTLDGSNTWLEGVTYYDNRYRVIQSQIQTLIGGVDRVTNRYDFVGQLLETKTAHGDKVILRSFDYDHAGRLINSWHKINEEPMVLLAHNEYNELGELIEKNLHQLSPAGGGAGGGEFAQSIDYRYNIRGWLTSINNAQLTDASNNDDTGQTQDYWGMELGYNNALSGVTATPAYNGNISAVKWSDNLGLGDATNIKERAYAYSYDPMNRIKTAQHSQFTSAWVANNHFKLEGLTYDLNGNIESLTRRDELGGSIDVLDYEYGDNGNQLKWVRDDGNDGEGFQDGTNGGDDYLYDDNGNMTQDMNKGITNITYNHLNLPTRVEKDANNYILYTYDAAGIKLRQEVYEGGSLTKTTDYVGEFIYENNDLQLIQHEEGRIIRGPDSGSRTYVYQYHLKDHLGNTRVTFTTQPETLDFEATMEATDEEALFSNLAETRATYLNANHTTGGNEAARLNQTKPVGPALSLPVGAGDIVDLEVYGYYEGGSGYNSTISVASMVAAVAGAFGGVSGGTETQQAIYDGFDGALTTVGGTSNDGVPAAYLNYVFFDENLVSYQEGFKQISGAANTNHERIHFDGETLQASKPGFVYIWVSSSSATNNWVYFDDLKVTLTEHAVIQTDDYYPGGLTFNSFNRITAKKNKYLYQSKEWQDDLDLGTYDFHARIYDPAIIRTWQQDPLAEKYYPFSSYSWVANNPIIFTDPTGMEIDWSQISGREKRIARRALRKHNSSGTYKNLYKQLKKSDNRYVIKAQNDGSMTGGKFEGNTSTTLDGPDGETMPFQNQATEEDFAPDEKGGIISLNFGLVEGLNSSEQASALGDLAVEEVVHAVQYDDANQSDNSTGFPGTANTEFEAKAIVGQIQAESRRDLYSAKADKIANGFGRLAFKTGNINGYNTFLKQWHTNPSLDRAYQIRSRTSAAPSLLLRLIKPKKR